MVAAGVSEPAISAFKRNYESLSRDESGFIGEDSITPVPDLVEFESISDQSDQGEDFSAELLEKTVVIKLNGGLGTSMGLQKAKSLLKVREDTTFLDIIAKQILKLRESTGAKVKFLLMNSFSTSNDSIDYLSKYDELGKREDIEFLQNQIPKIEKKTMQPAVCDDNPSLEWCPPGHGDIYTALLGSGMLDQLLSQGVKYAFVSNSDNLGAVLDASMLRYFAESDKPFMMEATRRTQADKKGGHLAVRNSDKQMLLREVAQTENSDLDEFQNVDKHRYFNTNSLWIRLDVLKQVLDETGGVLPLPMIKNNKTIDPRDKTSEAVYQLETAMGAAIECFPGAGAICVPRSRFAPVKATADLFSLRSDAYMITEEGRVTLIPEREGKPPVIALSSEYKLVDSLEGLGVPSMKHLDKLHVTGLVRFADHVVLKGDVTIINSSDETKWVAAGTYENETVEL